ncbi:MAG: sigma-54-dependent transcriptional regulator [Thermoguttaceae bacterium]
MTPQPPDDTPLSVLVIDDDVSHAEVVAEALAKMASVDCVYSEQAARDTITQRLYDVVVTDMALENRESGMAILRQIKQEAEETEVIVMTGHGSVALAVEAMQCGAFNFLQKPLDIKQLRTVVAKAGESSRLRRVNRELLQRLDERFGFGGVIGSSSAMRDVVERLKRIAPTDATVLIQGETGTGKELFAQAIHQNSQRKNKPFVALNCGAISESILESELFGHVKGAFTDASSDRLGKFEYASGGTLFLDEVGDMPMPTQIKLLRVLENGEITRVGANSVIKVNVRIISATNRNLEDAINAGTFRQDLYHRLKVVTIRIPSLRQRTGDIPILLDHFLKEFAKKNHKTIKGFATPARHILLANPWPGNVRELRNVVESMVVVDVDGILGVDDLPYELMPDAATTAANNVNTFTAPNADATLASFVGKPMEEIERMFIEQTLEACGGNRETAAKMLGIGERTLYRKIK